MNSDIPLLSVLVATISQWGEPVKKLMPDNEPSLAPFRSCLTWADCWTRSRICCDRAAFASGKALGFGADMMMIVSRE